MRPKISAMAVAVVSLALVLGIIAARAKSLDLGFEIDPSASIRASREVKIATWESDIKDPAVRDFREAVYSSLTDFTQHAREQDRKIGGMQHAIGVLFARVTKLEKESKQ